MAGQAKKIQGNDDYVLIDEDYSKEFPSARVALVHFDKNGATLLSMQSGMLSTSIELSLEALKRFVEHAQKHIAIQEKQ